MEKFRKRRDNELKMAKKLSKNRKLIENLNGTYHLNKLSLVATRPCIYFLKKDNHTVYIGETTCLIQRLADHVKEATKDFDSVSFFSFNGSNMERKAEEADLISKIKPIYNIVHIPK